LGTLRFLLALAVVSGHSPFGPIPGTQFIVGGTAVQAFFVISGFFITLVLCENPAYQSTFKFYGSRYLRLWPMYFVCAVPTLLLSSYNVYSFGSESATYVETFGRLDLLGKMFVLFSNLTIFLQDWTLFLQANWLTGTLSFTPNFNAGSHPIMARLLWDAPAWSLGIELVFYLIAPFIVRSPRRVLTLMAASLAVRIFVAQYQQMIDPWTYRFMPSELCMFCFGSIAYHLHKRSKAWQQGVLWRPLTTLFGVSGLVILIIAIAFHHTGLRASSRVLLLQSPALLLVIVAFIGPIFALTRSSKLDRWLGDMSYPTYLTHIGVFSVMTALGFQSGVTSAVAYTIATLIVATALLWLIDGPVTQFRKSALSAQKELKPALEAAQ
jgi:peptidoglycan/LPS O-acetylase OafA/YrhL